MTWITLTEEITTEWGVVARSACDDQLIYVEFQDAEEAVYLSPARTRVLAKALLQVAEAIDPQPQEA